MKQFLKKLGERLHTDRARGAAVSALLIALVIVVNAIVYALDVAYGLYFYTTETPDFSLSGGTDALFADAIERGERVSIIFCMPEENVSAHDTGTYVLKTAKEFAARYPDFISLSFVNIITRRDADGNRVDIGKYKTDKNGKNYTIGKTSVIFEHGDNFRVLTDTTSGAGYVDFYTLDENSYATSYNGEEVIASMVSWVLQEEHKSVYLTLYHGEKIDSAFYSLLQCAGFYVETLDLRTKDVPDDAAAVIISNPVKDFEKAAEGSGLRTEIEHLEHYLAGGGKLYAALDPYAGRLPVLETFLAGYGIRVSTTGNENRTLANIVKDVNDAITTDGFTLVASFADNDLASRLKSRATQYGGRVVLRDVAALELSGDAVPLLHSSSSSVTEAGGVRTSTGGNYTLAASAPVPNETGENGEIFVVPSVYLTSAGTMVTKGYANKDFVYALCEEFYGAAGVPYGCRAMIYNQATLENLTMGDARHYTEIILAIPALIAVAGAVVMIRRKNR